MIIAVKQEQMEREVIYHLAEVSREFGSRKFDEDMLENLGKTHFVFNMDNGKNLTFVKCREVKYAVLSLGGEAVTMVVRINGGKNAFMQPPFIVFQNKSRKYPIGGVANDVSGV